MTKNRQLEMVGTDIYRQTSGRYSVYVRRQGKRYKAGPFDSLQEAKQARRKLHVAHPKKQPGPQAKPKKQAARRTRHVERGIVSWAADRFYVQVKRQALPRTAGPFETIEEARIALAEIDANYPPQKGGRRAASRAFNRPLKAAPSPRPAAATADPTRCGWAPMQTFGPITGKGQLMRPCRQAPVLDGLCHPHALLAMAVHEARTGVDETRPERRINWAATAQRLGDAM